MSLRTRTTALLPEIVIIATAALVRFWRLGYHSIWFDEAVSLYWAIEAPLPYMWRTTFRLVEEKHPPVYYTLLRVWHEIFAPFGLGHSDGALRALGATLGVLTVLGMMLLVRRLSGRTTALLAALLTALAPVLVWYSQELRMFQPATTGVVWGAYFLIAAWQTEGRGARLGRWIGMVLCLSLANYAYLFSAFMLPAAGLTLVVLLFKKPLPTCSWFPSQIGKETMNRWGPFSAPPPNRGRLGGGFHVLASIPTLFQPQMDADGRRSPLPWGRFWEGAVAVGVAGLLFLPLALNAWAINSDTTTPSTAFAEFPETTRRLLKIFTIWKEDWPGALTEGALVGLGLLVLLGVTLPFRGGTSVEDGTKRAPWTDRLWLLLWIGVPWTIGNVLLLSSETVFHEDRYFIFVAPFVLWAIARGAVVLGTHWRWAGWISGGAAALLLAACLPRLWTPTMFRENWRAAAAYIEQYAEQTPALQSAVVAHISYTHRPLDWYLRQPYTMDELPVWGLFGEPLTQEMVDSTVAPPLLGIVEWGADTLWLTQSHLEGVDDARLVEGWLEEQYPLVTEQYPNGVKLTGYALQSDFATLPELADNGVRADSALAPDLTLVACEITTPKVRATDQQLHPPSGWVHVRLWWRATTDIPKTYTVTARVVGSQGVWGEKLDRGEREALRRFGTSTWPSDTFHRDEHDIGLNPLTPPGEYHVVIGLQDESGTELETQANCGAVQIAP